MNNKLIFDTVRPWLDEEGFTPERISALDAAIAGDPGAVGGGTGTGAAQPSVGRHIGPNGIALMHEFEGCKLTAYPDPGSVDGNPWTIGWGSTGPGISKGVTWTQAQADERFKQDLVKYENQVLKAIGNAPTTQNQFDALVSFHYNTGAIGSATLTKKHNAGDYAGAVKEFAKWNKNDGKVMAGLTRRRAAEAELYGRK